jgi:acetyl-CoA carboxylase biotin carboxyl carrier protein
MIDIRKLKELVRIMVANDLTELDLKDTEQEVNIRRPDGNAPAMVTGVPGVSLIAPPPAALAAAPVAAAPVAVAEPPVDAGLVAIESPMVGTFYISPSPDKPPFVSPGESVKVGDVLCLIEAMKIFNEIKAEHSGTVEKILLENGAAVEFGQAIMMIRPL